MDNSITIIDLLRRDPDETFDDVVLSTVILEGFIGDVTSPILPSMSLSGNWQLTDEALVGEAAANEWAIASFNPALSLKGVTEAGFAMPLFVNATLNPSEAGQSYVVFDYESASEFKFVLADAVGERWQIGHVSGGQIYVDAEQHSPSRISNSVIRMRIDFGLQDEEHDAEPYYGGGISVSAEFTGTGWIPLFVKEDGTNIIVFPGAQNLWDGEMALATYGGSLGSETSFAGIRVGTTLTPADDDPETTDLYFARFGHRENVRALGVTAGGVAYFSSGNSDFVVGNYTAPLYATGAVDPSDLYPFEHYATLAFETGGSAWDIQQFRGNASLAGVFSDAFADAVAAQTALNSELLQLTSSDGVASAEVDASQTGAEHSFLVTLTGDGRAHAFNLEFAQNQSTIATIPVRIEAPYAVYLFASDADGPEPLVFEWAAGFDGTAMYGAKLVTSEPGGPRVNDRLEWDADAWYRNLPGEQQSQAQTVRFAVTVRDGKGAAAVTPLQWTVTVRPPAANSAPTVDGVATEAGATASLVAEVGAGKQWQGVANDINVDGTKDPLHYELAYPNPATAPSGMSIDNRTGIITWVPGSQGTFDFRIVVSDGRLIQVGENWTPAVGTKDMSVVVGPRTFANVKPSIAQVPSGFLYVGQSFVYPLQASDVNHDPLTYLPIAKPDEMDLTHGVLSWTPQRADAGKSHTIVVGVDDGRGGFNSTTFIIEVLSRNVAPEFLPSLADATRGAAGKDFDYKYPLFVRDENGDKITFRVEAGPEGMRVEYDAEQGFWFLAWNKDEMPSVLPAEGERTFPVKVVADDGKQGETLLSFDLTLEPASPPQFFGTYDLRFPGPTAENPAPFESDFEILSYSEITDLIEDVVVDAKSQLRGVYILADPQMIKVTRPDGESGPYLYSGMRLVWPVPLVGHNSIAVTGLNSGGASGTAILEFDVLPPVEQASNSPPQIRTAALGPFAVNAPFEDFQLDVIDPDGHRITAVTVESGTSAPGFTQDNVRIDDGRAYVSWTPTTAGYFSIVLSATDSLGTKSAPHQYNFLVEANARPEVRELRLSDPAFLGKRYTYPFRIIDLTDDPITVTLNEEAVDAGIRAEQSASEPSHWSLVWDDPGPVGFEVPIRVEINDGLGEPVAFRFPIPLPVYDSNDLEAPLDLGGGTAISVPAGTEFTHRFVISAQGGALPRFSAELLDPLNEVPTPLDGPEIDEDGVLKWTPSYDSVNQQGQFVPYQATIRVVLDFDGETPDLPIDLDFDVTAPTGLGGGPTITSSPPHSAEVGRQYRYPLETDGGVGQVTWHFEGLHPSEMRIARNEEGTGWELTWNPTTDYLGEAAAVSIDVTLRASDSLSQSAVQRVSIRLAGASPKPTVLSSFPNAWNEDLGEFEFPLPLSSVPGVEYEFSLTPAYDGSLPADTWEIDSQGVVRWDEPIVGDYAFNVHIADRNDPDWSVDFPAAIRVYPTGQSTPIKPLVLDAPFNGTLSAELPFTRPITIWNPLNVATTLAIVSGQVTSGAQMSVAGGEFSWTPDREQVGEYDIVVAVLGAGDVQLSTVQLHLRVVDNKAPVIEVPAELNPIVGTIWTYTVDARDPEGKALGFLVEPVAPETSLPEGFTFNSSTRTLRWDTPNAAPTSPPQIRISATDIYGATTTRVVTLSLAADDQPPTISFHVENGDGKLVRPGDTLDAELYQEYALWLSTDDNLGPENVRWDIHVEDSATANEVTHPIDITGQPGGLSKLWFTAGLNPGLLTITVTAYNYDDVTTIASNVTQQTFRYYVEDESTSGVAKLLNIDDTTAPIESRFYVIGNALFADDFGAGEYFLRLTSLDDPNDFVDLTPESNTASILNGEIAVIDPTLLKSGQYRLYLEVRCANDCVQAIDERIIEIRNDSKLGNLDLAFTDLQVDLGGVPVSLVRSYSSSLVGEGNRALANDFGPGWSLNLLQSRVEVSHPDHVTTRVDQPLAAASRLLFTLPDGSVHRFLFQPEKLGSSDDSPFEIRFRPDPDELSTLEFDELDPSLLLRWIQFRDDGTFVASSTGQDFIAATFAAAFRVRTPAGTSYLFDARTGQLNAIENDAGQRVIIVDDSVSSMYVVQTEGTSAEESQRVEIRYERYRALDDGTLEAALSNPEPTDKRRITEIRDPNYNAEFNSNSGNALRYVYGDFDEGLQAVNTSAAIGNLSQVVRRDGTSIYLDYANAAFPRHLTEIYDQSFVRVIQADYYDSSDFTAPLDDASLEKNGRLQSLRDATNQEAGLNFTINLGDGRMVTKTTADGIAVDEVKNSRGNVLRRVQLLDGGLPETDADDKYLVTAYRYNQRGLLTHESNPFVVIGAEDRYDQSPVTPEESLAEDLDENRLAWARIITYDGEGRVTTSTDSYGAVTTFKYEEGRLIEARAPSGAVSHTVYDFGTGVVLESYLTDGKTDFKYNRSRFEYDEFDRRTKTFQIQGETETLVAETSYNDFGQVMWTKDAAGLVRYFDYDVNGNQINSWYNWSDEDPLSPALKAVVTHTEFDLEDRPISTLEYDLSGNYEEQDIVSLRASLDVATPVSTTSTSYDKGRVEKTIDRFGAETWNEYDVRGNVIETRSQAKNEADVPGWLVSRTLYDDQGRVKFASDPYFVAGAVYSPSAISDDGYGTRSVYDPFGRVVRTERYAGVAVTIAGSDVDVVRSDVSGTPAAVFPGDGSPNPNVSPHSSSQTSYDDLGRVQYSVSETDARTDYYYDVTGRQIAVLGPVVLVDGVSQRHLTESDFDAAGRLTQSRSNIAVTNWGQNLHPDVSPGTAEATRDDAAVRRTFFEYDAAGRQTAVVSTLVSDPDGNAATLDGYHIRTETSYDLLGRRIASREGIKQTDPLDVTTIDPADQRETTFEYDSSGNLVAVNLPTIVIPNDYRNPGNPAEVRPRYEYRYDVFGNRTQLTTNAYFNEASSEVVYLRKNASGVDEMSDWRGIEGELPAEAYASTTVFEFDHRGRQTSRQLPEGVAGGGFTETMVYVDEAVGGSESVGNGQLNYSVDFEGRVTAYLYDNTTAGGGRLVKKSYFPTATAFDGGAGTPSQTVVYEYDAFSRQVSAIVDPTPNAAPSTDLRTTTTEYDEEGRVVTANAPEGWVKHEYSRKSGLLVRTYSEHSDLRYTYDELGRLYQVIAVKLGDDANIAGSNVDWTDADGMVPSVTGDVTTHAYDLVGNLRQVALQNGLLTDYSYDELNRLTREVSYKEANSQTGYQPSSTDVLRGDFAYTVDSHNKRTALVETINGGTGAVESQVDWTYDALGRLASEEYDYDVTQNSADDFFAKYEFDLVGNRLTKSVDKDFVGAATFVPDEAFGYVYDDNDRLLSETFDDRNENGSAIEKTTTYAYDTATGAGKGTEQTGKTEWFGTNVGGSQRYSATTYDYNLQGRLETITATAYEADGTTTASETTTTFAYDDDGVRVSQTIDGVTTLYVVDLQNPTGYSQLLDEGVDANEDGHLDANAEVARSYVLGHDVIAQAVKQASDMVVQYLMYDGHASTRVLLDGAAAPVLSPADGNQAQVYAYDAYGSLLTASGLVATVDKALTTLLYSGEQTDTSGLQQLRARYYSANNGRFTQSDGYAGNLFDPRSLHKYLYAHGDPVNGFDPTGNYFSAVSALFNLLEQVASYSQVLQIALSPNNNNVVIRHTITMLIDFNNLPERFDPQAVEARISESLQAAGLPVRVFISNGVSRASNVTRAFSSRRLAYGFQDASASAFNSEYIHGILVDRRHRFLHTRGIAFAQTPGRSQPTTLYESVLVTYMKDHRETKPDILYANILMHELFYHAIENVHGHPNAQTRLEDANDPSNGTLLRLEQHDIERIMRVLDAQ